jgi:glucose-1-phosphate thymidylyltransferase
MPHGKSGKFATIFETILFISNPYLCNNLSILKTNSDIIGLIPAAGEAKRLSPLPCSKELYPIGMQFAKGKKGKKPKVVAHDLLEKMRLAGVLNAFFIIRKGKWDIPGYFGDGALLDMNIGYLMMNLRYGTAYTIDQAYPFVKDKTIVFGFPDILFSTEDAFGQLINKQKLTNADIVLGLFPAGNPEKVDMVELNAEGRICGIDIKPTNTTLVYTWIIAVWSGGFTKFLHNHVKADLYMRSNNTDDALAINEKELSIGDSIKSAMLDRMKIDTVIFSNGKFLDIGTPEDLEKVHRKNNELLFVL